MTRTHEHELRRYRAFYLSYPQIRETVSPELPHDIISAAPQPGITPPKPNGIPKV